MGVGTIGEYHRGGEYQSYFYTLAQWSFSSCLPQIGCLQFRYPQAWQQVGGQGGYVSNRQIADRLYLSPHTVARHLANARAKLGASNRAEAAVRLEKSREP